MRSPKWPDDIDFQFNGITVLCLGEAFLPWERRPLEQQSLMLQKQKAKLFLVTHQVGRVTGTTFFLTPPAWAGESWLWEKQRHV